MDIGALHCITCVGWQVTLCDPKSQVASRFPWRAIHNFNLFSMYFTGWPKK